MTSRSADSPFDDRSPEGRLLRAFLDQGRKVTRRITDVASWPAGQEILDESPELRARVVALVSSVLAQGNERRTAETHGVTKIGNVTISSFDPRGLKTRVGWTHRQGVMMKALMGRLLRSRLPFAEEQLTGMVEDLRSEEAWNWDVPAASVMTAVERHVRQHGLSERLRQELAALRTLPEELPWITMPKAVCERLDRLLV